MLAKPSVNVDDVPPDRAEQDLRFHTYGMPRNKTKAKKNAANDLAFTGTTLLGRDRKTNACFGNYVSEYNVQQSVGTAPRYRCSTRSACPRC